MLVCSFEQRYEKMGSIFFIAIYDVIPSRAFIRFIMRLSWRSAFLSSIIRLIRKSGSCFLCLREKQWMG